MRALQASPRAFWTENPPLLRKRIQPLRSRQVISTVNASALRRHGVGVGVYANLWQLYGPAHCSASLSCASPALSQHSVPSREYRRFDDNQPGRSPLPMLQVGGCSPPRRCGHATIAESMDHGGEGWEARVEKVRSRDGQAEALVVFVARKTRSTEWQPMWLQLANLRPLH